MIPDQFVVVFVHVFIKNVLDSMITSFYHSRPLTCGVTLGIQMAVCRNLITAY